MRPHRSDGLGYNANSARTRLCELHRLAGGDAAR